MLMMTDDSAVSFSGDITSSASAAAIPAAFHRQLLLAQHFSGSRAHGSPMTDFIPFERYAKRQTAQFPFQQQQKVENDIDND
jgi:hypothetical protein